MQRYLSFILMAALTGGLYINCSGFKGANGLGAGSFGSASCKANFKAAPQPKLDASSCENVDDYTCEERIFSPTVDNGSSLNTFCGMLDDKSVCVKTRTFSYNTEAARATASVDEFEDGGDYNRDEYQCSHILGSVNAPVFQAQGDSIVDALSKSMQLCSKRAAQ